MLMSIWATGTTRPEPQVTAQVSFAAAVKLSAQSRVVEPLKQAQRLGDIAAQRKVAA
jgi:hypothetical protein